MGTEAWASRTILKSLGNGGNSGLMAAGRWEFSRLAHPAKYQDGREQLQGIDSAAMETIEIIMHTDAGDENEAIGDRKSLD